MPICAQCGHEVPEGSRFCNSCGAAMETAPRSREQRKVVTVLFCDVAGSTALGERLDPESLRGLLARYFAEMSAIVERHGGTVEKFIGDAVMAVFGVPAVHEDDALRALRAASEMTAALPALGVEGRIGVTTGEVVTGTAERLATGDAVNVAARLQQAATPGTVLLGEETYRLARGAIDVEAVEPLSLKGKAAPVPVYRLLAVRAGEGFARRLDAPMIGRETELRRLRDAYDQAVQDNSCQLFSVLGPAGVGKSRLVAEFVGSVNDARVVRGRCLPYGEGITYWPVVEVVKQLAEVKVEGAVGEAIRSLLGETQTVTEADEIAWAVRKLLEAAAAETPLVCFFDDIHWGEQTFLDLVEHVADLSRSAPILVLCSARPELLDQRTSWGGGKLNATTVLLEPLDAESTDQLMSSLGELDDGLRSRIREAAEGNPLFVEQMVALVRDSSDSDVAVPPTIQALLAARLDQLEVPERNVLEAGSVEGRLFHRGAVQALAPDEPQVTSRLTALVRKELVRPDTAQLPGEDAFRFRHLLIRDAAYEALPKAERAELHARFADWLEVNGSELVEVDEILGYHLEQAVRYRSELGLDIGPELAAQARSRLGRAGRRALARQDAAAVGLLERAVALLPTGDYDGDLELELADALFGSRPNEVEALTTSLAERACRHGDRVTELSAELFRGITRLYVDATAEMDALEELIDDARPELEDAGEPLALFVLWLGIATIGHGRLQNLVKLDAAERAVSYAQLAGDERRVTALIPFLASARYFGPTPVDESLAWIEEQAAVGGEHFALDGTRAQYLAMVGRFDEARAVVDELRGRLDDRGLAVPAAINCTIAGEIERLAGDDEAALRFEREGCDRLEAMGHVSWLSTSLGDLGRLHCDVGRYDEADALAERSKQLGSADDVATQAIWRRVRALVLAQRGDRDEADRLARAALELMAPTDSINAQAETLLDLAEVLEVAGRKDEADQTLQQAVALFEQKGNIVMAGRARDRLAKGAQ